MPSISEYSDYSDALRDRRAHLQRRASEATHIVVRRRSPHDVEVSHLIDAALAELRAAEEELRTQNEELFAARTEMESSAAHLRDLFELAPVAYLVTDVDGLIAEANVAACSLLGRAANALVGKPLACYVELAERSAFRAALLRSSASHGVEEWPIRLAPKGSMATECRVQVRTLRSMAGRPRALAWIIVASSLDPLDGM